MRCRYTKWSTAAATAKSLQSCPTLCDPAEGSPPGSPIPGILQTRTLAWVAISFSSAWKWKMKVTSLSCVLLLLTPWTAAYQAPPSMGFSRQAYTLTLNCIIFTKWTMYIGFWIPESVFQKIHYFIHWVRVCFRKSSAHSPPRPPGICSCLFSPQCPLNYL